jgi:Na+/proline symporter
MNNNQSTNWYFRLEDKWTEEHYHSIIEEHKYCGFNPGSSEGQSALMSIRWCIRLMIISSILFVAAYISPYPLAAFPLWLIFVAALWKNAHEEKMSSGYPYLEPMGGLWVGIFSMLLIPVFFIGYAALNYIGGLVDGVFYTSLAQFGVGIIALILLAIYGHSKGES